MPKRTAAVLKKRRYQQHSRSSRRHTGSQSSCFHQVRSCYLPPFRRPSMCYSHAQTKPADHRVNWTQKQIDHRLPASYARQKVKLHWGVLGMVQYLLLWCAYLSVDWFCCSFQPQLGPETASASPGGVVSGWRMCYVHVPPAVMAESTSLLQPCGLDTPLSGVHCELFLFPHTLKMLSIKKTRLLVWCCNTRTRCFRSCSREIHRQTILKFSYSLYHSILINKNNIYEY